MIKQKGINIIVGNMIKQKGVMSHIKGKNKTSLDKLGKNNKS